MTKFASSIDQVSNIITGSVIVLCLYFFYRGFYTARPVSEIVFFLLVFMVIAMYVLKPVSLSVEDTGIVIERKIMPKLIPFSEIKSIRALQDTELFGAVRTFGNGGLFGYTGYYYSRKMGSMLWYCTQRRNFVLIETTANKKIIVSPDDPEQFVHAVVALSPGLKAS